MHPMAKAAAVIAHQGSAIRRDLSEWPIHAMNRGRCMSRADLRSGPPRFFWPNLGQHDHSSRRWVPQASRRDVTTDTVPREFCRYAANFLELPTGAFHNPVTRRNGAVPDGAQRLELPMAARRGVDAAPHDPAAERREPGLTVRESNDRTGRPGWMCCRPRAGVTLRYDATRSVPHRTGGLTAMPMTEIMRARQKWKPHSHYGRMPAPCENFRAKYKQSAAVAPILHRVVQVTVIDRGTTLSNGAAHAARR
jgi:hypothetical protein